VHVSEVRQSKKTRHAQQLAMCNEFVNGYH